MSRRNRTNHYSSHTSAFEKTATNHYIFNKSKMLSNCWACLCESLLFFFFLQRQGQGFSKYLLFPKLIIKFTLHLAKSLWNAWQPRQWWCACWRRTEEPHPWWSPRWTEAPCEWNAAKERSWCNVTTQQVTSTATFKAMWAKAMKGYIHLFTFLRLLCVRVCVRACVRACVCVCVCVCVRARVEV